MLDRGFQQEYTSAMVSNPSGSPDLSAIQRYLMAGIAFIMVSVFPLVAPARLRAAGHDQSATHSVKAVIGNIRYWTTADYTRISIDLDRRVHCTSSRLSNPDRVFLDFEETVFSGDLKDKVIDVGDGLLQRIRTGQNQPVRARIVFDLLGTHDYTVSRLRSPERIVVEIRQASAKTAVDAHILEEKPPPRPPSGAQPVKAGIESELNRSAGSKSQANPSPLSSSAQAGAPGVRSEIPMPSSSKIGVVLTPASTSEVGKTAAPELLLPTIKSPDKVSVPKPAAPTSRGDRTLARMLGLKIGRIVIDPGHGGHDMGSVGPDGFQEKDLVLRIARMLRRLLEENLGVEVLLTRDADVFLSLEERTAIANQNHADLFISIHANASRSRSSSGVETYFLDFARTAAEREVAARENAAAVHNYRDLEALVQKIARAEKMAESRELAAVVQKHLYGSARQVFPATQNRGVRSAPFVVLIGAKMPSVLAEIAFISNPRDEKLLKKEDTQRNLAKAMLQGIEGYMKAMGSLITQSQTSSNP